MAKLRIPKHKLRHALNESNGMAEQFPELQALKDKDVFADWNELVDMGAQVTNNQDAIQDDILKRAAKDRTRPVNISKIDAIEVIRPDGSTDTIQPARIAALTRAAIADLYTDSQTKVLAKYFAKDIIWTFDPAISTAATDGIRVFMNPIFGDELLSRAGAQMAKEKKAGGRVTTSIYTGIQYVLIHEIYHQLYQHFRREQLKPETAGHKNHLLANISEDCEINRDIERIHPKFAGWTELMGGCIDNRFTVETWEQIFDAYFANKVNNPFTPPQNNGQAPRKKQQGQQGNQQQGSQAGQSSQQSQQGQQQQGQQGNQQGQQSQSGQQSQQGQQSQSGQQGQNGQQGSQSQNGQDGQNGQQSQSGQSRQQQSGQQGQNGSQGNQNGQNNNDGSGNGQPKPPTVEQQDPFYQAGVLKALEDIKAGRIQIQALSSNIVPKTAAEKEMFDKGYNDVIEAYKAAVEQRKNQQNQQNDGGQQGSGQSGQQGGGQSGNQGGQGAGGQGGTGQSGEGGDGSGQGGEGGNSGSGMSGSDDSDEVMGQNETVDGSQFDAAVQSTDTFGGNDIISKELAQRIAEEAGQPYDSQDMSTDAKEKAEVFIKENKEAFKGIGGKGSGRGFSLYDAVEKINAMFIPKVDWRRMLKRFFNSVGKSETTLDFSRKMLGSDHPAYRDAKYTKPREITREVKSGVAQVFHLIDNSGSMHWGNDNANFEQIFSEIIEMGKRCKIRNSAMTYFSDGPIKTERIRTWKDSTSTPVVLKHLQMVNDLSGGTNCVGSILEMLKLKKPYFSLTNPSTLLLVYSDGDIEFNMLSQIPYKLMRNIIWMIITESDKKNDSVRESLIQAGCKASQVLCINWKESKRK